MHIGEEEKMQNYSPTERCVLMIILSVENVNICRTLVPFSRHRDKTVLIVPIMHANNPVQGNTGFYREIPVM